MTIPHRNFYFTYCILLNILRSRNEVSQGTLVFAAKGKSKSSRQNLSFYCQQNPEENPPNDPILPVDDQDGLLLPNCPPWPSCPPPPPPMPTTPPSRPSRPHNPPTPLMLVPHFDSSPPPLVNFARKPVVVVRRSPPHHSHNGHSPSIGSASTTLAESPRSTSTGESEIRSTVDIDDDDSPCLPPRIYRHIHLKDGKLGNFERLRQLSWDLDPSISEKARQIWKCRQGSCGVSCTTSSHLNLCIDTNLVAVKEVCQAMEIHTSSERNNFSKVWKLLSSSKANPPALSSTFIRYAIYMYLSTQPGERPRTAPLRIRAKVDGAQAAGYDCWKGFRRFITKGLGAKSSSRHMWQLNSTSSLTARRRPAS